MRIFLQDIKEIESDLQFTQEDAWIFEAVTRCDEREDGESRSARPKAREIDARIVLRKVDEVFLVTGKLRTQVQLLCSRCANPYGFDVSPRFSCLYCQDPEMAGIAHLAKNPDDRDAPGVPRGQNKGFARHAHESEESEEGFGKDLDITYISEDFIDLSDLVTEQLRLQIPFQPLCMEDCKGVCSRCGADQNIGQCACAKIAKESPFAALRNFKV